MSEDEIKKIANGLLHILSEFSDQCQCAIGDRDEYKQIVEFVTELQTGKLKVVEQ